MRPGSPPLAFSSNRMSASGTSKGGILRGEGVRGVRCRLSSGEKKGELIGAGGCCPSQGWSRIGNAEKHVYKYVYMGHICIHTKPGACDVFLFNGTDGRKQPSSEVQTGPGSVPPKFCRRPGGFPEAHAHGCACQVLQELQVWAHLRDASCGRGPRGAPGSNLPRAPRGGFQRASLSKPHPSIGKVGVFSRALARFTQFHKHIL